uniref:GH18 domain-containing protein n=1 Tax=Anopheles farauti TaxID=69004 RepID=A0A182QY16_9DIPT
MDRNRLPCLLLLVSFICAFAPEAAAQRSRVCLAQSSDYSSSTALGFCSHAVYIALNPTSRGFVGTLNPANDSDDLLGGIRKFVSRKQAYPWVEMYMGVLGSVQAGNILWLGSTTTRRTFIDLLISKVQLYTEMSGVYLDFVGLTNNLANGYSRFVSELNTALVAVNLRLITALPWDATAFADIYFNPTLPTLPFNVIKTHEDMYGSVTNTHPLNPVFSLASPFNLETRTIYNNVFRWVLKGFLPNNIVISLPMYSLKFTTSGATTFNGAAGSAALDTYCNALLFGASNTLGTPQAGEGFAYSANTFYTYNTAASLVDKLNFATSTNMGGVALFSLDQAGSANAEMLRQVTSVLAPTPAAGVTYPPALPPTCGVPITFPAPPTTTTVATTTTTTTTPTTTTTTTTPTTTTTTTTPTTTTTTTTPTTTTTTTPTTTTTTTPTTTTTTTTPTTTTTTTPTTTTTTTTPTTTTTTTPTTTTTTTPTTTSTTTTGPTTTTVSVSTTLAASADSCGLTINGEYGNLVQEYCLQLKAIAAYNNQGASCGVVATEFDPSLTTPTVASTTTTTTPTTTTTTTTPTTTTTTTTPTTTTTTTPTTTTTTTATTTTTTAPTTTTTTAITTTTIAPSPDTCNLPVSAEYKNLVAEYCAQLKAVAEFITTGASCGVVA